MNEEWRPVPGFEGLYSISSMGRVRRDAPGHGARVGYILKPGIRNGYPCNRHLSRVSHDTGLGIFRSLLGYKAMEAGALVKTVNPKNTSQACSGCGCIIQKPLSVRIHACSECGLTLDRDVNAARNILMLGRSSQALTQPVRVFVV